MIALSAAMGLRGLKLCTPRRGRVQGGTTNQYTEKCSLHLLRMCFTWAKPIQTQYPAVPFVKAGGLRAALGSRAMFALYFHFPVRASAVRIL